MKSVVSKFASLEAADQAEDEYYASLTPAERMAILLELIARTNESLGEPAQGLERVCRVTQLERD